MKKERIRLMNYFIEDEISRIKVKVSSTNYFNACSIFDIWYFDDRLGYIVQVPHKYFCEHYIMNIV